MYLHSFQSSPSIAHLHLSAKRPPEGMEAIFLYIFIIVEMTSVNISGTDNHRDQRQQNFGTMAVTKTVFNIFFLSVMKLIEISIVFIPFGFELKFQRGKTLLIVSPEFIKKTKQVPLKYLGHEFKELSL